MITLRSRVRAMPIAFVFVWTLHHPFATNAAVNQWSAIGPDSAHVVALAVDPATPSTIYAGTVGAGALKSIDAGTTWSPINQGLTNADVAALAIDPVARSTLYAGTDAGVFKSLDGGAHWTAAYAGLAGATPVVRGIAIGPDTAAVYAATSAGVLKSTDGGATWRLLDIGQPRALASVVTIDPSSPSTLYAGIGDFTNGRNTGLYKSIDGGATWGMIRGAPVDIDFGPWPVVGLAVDPRAPLRLYLAFADGSLLRSTDGGATWTGTGGLPFSGLGISSLTVDFGPSDALYVGTYDGSLYTSGDAGASWNQVPATSGLRSSSINVVALAAAPPGSVYLGASNGLFRSIDGGATWSRSSLGVQTAGIASLVVDLTVPSTIYASVEGVVMKTIDGGAHWVDTAPAPPPGTRVGLLALDPQTSSTLYETTVLPSGYAPNLYKSIDGGASWALIYSAANDVSIGALAIAPSQPSTMFIGRDVTGVMRSTDGGASWTVANSGLTGRYVSALAVDPMRADIVYAAMSAGAIAAARVFKSIDSGDHWQALPISLPKGALVTRLAIDPHTPSTLYAAYGFGDLRDTGVFRSVDGGASWTPVQTPPMRTPTSSAVSALAIDPANPGRIYAATGEGVFRSTDAAASWTPLNAGLPTRAVSDISIDRTGTRLRAATAAGLFEYQWPDPSSPRVSVIEYYDAELDHYFITAIPDEIAKLDNAVVAGWTRTGLQFNAYGAGTVGGSPVCRFFSTAFATKSSHFYSPLSSECAATNADPRWTLESVDVFDIAVPSADGSCATGLVAVYRLYNDGHGGAPNHRYTIDRAVRAQMIAQGWVPEGLGPDAVQMCAPR